MSYSPYQTRAAWTLLATEASACAHGKIGVCVPYRHLHLFGLLVPSIPRSYSTVKMAGPGGGPPRRSHTKSRKGCETCKRRHIRCDESFPQCRNCTKHKIRCPYNDIQVPEAEAEKADLMWTPKIEHDIALWKSSGVFPFPEVETCPVPMAHMYSLEDLRLIYHVASLYSQLASFQANNFTVWTRHIPNILRIGATTPYVMHALLAFSAMHIAFLTDCPLVGSMAFEHRGIALKGLKEAIGSFSRETSDAVLAASLVLSWQAIDWPSWISLMQGTSTVIDAMELWKGESLFGDFIAESSTFASAPHSPSSDQRRSQPSPADLEAYQATLSQVQKLETHLKRNRDETGQVQQLIAFLKGSRKLSPSLSIAARYERLQPLRTLLFWMPVGHLQTHRDSPNALVTIAHLYSAALVMERLFPEIGAAYFGSLSVTPIEEIARRLMSTSQHQSALILMEHPLDTVREFRLRMGWLEPTRTPSFPQFHPPNFAVAHHAASPGAETQHHHETQQHHQHHQHHHHHHHQQQQQQQHHAHHQPQSYLHYGGVSFSYSTDELPLLNSTAMPQQQQHASSASPLLMASAFPHHHYLNIPSPSYAQGAYSPASSSFDGSAAYSDADDYPQTVDMGSAMAAYSHGPPAVMLGEAHRPFGVGNPPSRYSSMPPTDRAPSCTSISPPRHATEGPAWPRLAESSIPLASVTQFARNRHAVCMASTSPYPASPLTRAPLVAPAYHGRHEEAKHDDSAAV
ncbi:hypothetical protein CDD81_409 [Ophiocordyceps australis]|uniref:Zn(2)-C6 fungal-type domain-containing protein n=1 Tax=Ophiocordyceps australis TaxID=1399860 RepID=A0A2C5Y347_9HYPO|nr:hypothetical protein CDD81_409 [Ophiocordyceps australis]